MPRPHTAPNGMEKADISHPNRRAYARKHKSERISKLPVLMCPGLIFHTQFLFLLIVFPIVLVYTAINNL